MAILLSNHEGLFVFQEKRLDIGACITGEDLKVHSLHCEKGLYVRAEPIYTILSPKSTCDHTSIHIEILYLISPKKQILFSEFCVPRNFFVPYTHLHDFI